MVQRLPDVGMIPTSQEGGGLIHDPGLAMTAPGSPPGFDGGTYSYPQTTDAPAAMPAPVPVGDTPRVPAGHPSGQGGQFVKTPTAS